MSNLLATLREEFQEEMVRFAVGVKREAVFPRLPHKIMVAIGMRRTGKTYFLLQKIKALMDSGVVLSQIFYLNFEDDRLAMFDQKQLVQLLDEFYALYPENHQKECYLFLDEIQNMSDWPRVIRRYFDTKKVQIYLTGSSAKLLSKEIATSLRGRSYSIEIWPFNFREYLDSQRVQLPEKTLGKKTMDAMLRHLHDYLRGGGFPEVVKIHVAERLRILQDYVDLVVFRDIIERYSITNISLVRYLIKTLLRNVGTSFAVNKFYKDLKSQGFSVAKTTVHEYLGYIEDAYLAFTVPLYSESVRKMQTNPRKIYVVDSGLAAAYSLSMSRNMGHYFKNLVYLDLRRRGEEVYYYLTKDRYEVDFLTRDLYGKLHLYQVVWDNQDAETMARELRALKEAEKELGIKGKIITPESYIASLCS